MREIPFCEVGGFKLGHAQDETALTGCTVLLCDKVSPAGVAIFGGGPASRETPLLNPLADASGIHAILLSGGSAFGLDAAGGVMQYLEAKGIGYQAGPFKVPLVCQSCVFDLMLGDGTVRPDANMAKIACENATTTQTQTGNVGVGIGCSVGKIAGFERAMKGGFATYAVEVGNIKIGAMVAVNALGDIFDAETSKQIAGLRTADGKSLASSEDAIVDMIEEQAKIFSGNTTIGAIVTNAKFTKAELNKIAQMGHNGYARAIKPVHTTVDGDSIYAVSTGDVVADINAVGTIGATVMTKAITKAILTAKSAGGVIAVSELG